VQFTGNGQDDFRQQRIASICMDHLQKAMKIIGLRKQSMQFKKVFE